MTDHHTTRRYWFAAKTYGWGWMPATWEGWLVLLGFIALNVGNWYRLHPDTTGDDRAAVAFAVETFVLVAVLLWICWKKGEAPRWRWGK